MEETLKRLSGGVALPLLTLLPVALFFGAFSLFYPFGFDQANQAYLAYRLHLGDVLFRDAACLKPPLTIYFHLAAIKLFGINMHAVRILDCVWAALISLTLYRFCAELFDEQGRRLGLFAGLFYLVMYYSHNFWYTAQTDGWLNLPVAAAMLAAARAYRGEVDPVGRTWRWGWFSAGALCVAAMLFKYTAASFFIVPAALSLLKRRSNRAAGNAALVGLFAGAAAAGLLFLAWLAATGALGGYLHEHLQMVSAYGQKAIGDPSGRNGDGFLSMLGRLNTFLPGLRHLASSPNAFHLGAFGLLYALYRTFRRENERFAWLVIFAWLVGAWISTAIQGRWFPYHYLPLLPVWAIFAASLLVAILDSIASVVPGKALRAVICSALVVLSTFGIQDINTKQHLSPGDYFRMLYDYFASGVKPVEMWERYSFFNWPLNYSAAASAEVTDYLAANFPPNDSIFVYGSDMSVYFLSQRPRVSKIDSSFQASGLAATPVGTPGASLIDDLTRNPPRIFLVQDDFDWSVIFGRKVVSDELFEADAKVSAFVRANYREVKFFPQFRVFRYTGGKREALGPSER